MFWQLPVYTVMGETSLSRTCRADIVGGLKPEKSESGTHLLRQPSGESERYARFTCRSAGLFFRRAPADTVMRFTRQPFMGRHFGWHLRRRSPASQPPAINRNRGSSEGERQKCHKDTHGEICRHETSFVSELKTKLKGIRTGASRWQLRASAIRRSVCLDRPD